MISRKIQAPGVEVDEIDLSQYGNLNLDDTTVVLLNGFSDKGDNNTTKIVTSIPDFTTEYGYPTTEAERYLYNAVKQTLVHGGVPAITKIPYQNNSLSTYSACQYKIGGTEVISGLEDLENFIDVLSGICGLKGQNEEISSLDYSEQVSIFEDFINGICDFNSFGLSPDDLGQINSLLFNGFDCYRNLRGILEGGSNEEDLSGKICMIMTKNGYDDFGKFFEDLSKTITKEQFLKCLNAVDGTSLSVEPYISSEVESLKNADLAMVQGMDTFVSIEAKTYGTSATNFIGSITFEQYDDCLIGDKGNLPDGTITIVDITRSKYEKDKLVQNEDLSSAEYIGIVPVLVSPVNAMVYQNILDDTVENVLNYNIVSSLETPKGLSVRIEDLEIPPMSFSNHGTSLGRIAESYFPKIDYYWPTKLDNTLLHKVGIVVFKMTIDVANGNKINFTPVEAFFGSLNRKDKDLITNTSDYLEDIVNNQSQYINVFIKMSDSKVAEILKASTLLISNQPAFSLGFSSEDCVKDISVELIADSLRLAFDHLQNPNTLKIDIVADAGMSNIAQYIANTTFSNIGKFEIADNYNFPIRNQNSIKVWKNIIDLYDDFCKNVRKDCMFIADSPRNFCLAGNQKLVRRSNPSNTIENTILPALRFMVDFDTSYGAGYSNWFRCIDDTLRYYMWMPPTVKALEAYLVTDNQYNFWDAPAGLRRGVMTETFDVAFNPAEKDAEKLYINRWNYAVSFPLEGIILEGQKTFQKNRTAFDRVNVRRLFLKIEKDVRMMARSFLYEPISTRNLQKLNDMVNTYLADIQTKDGIRQFYVICDGRNNTNETIDNNEIHMAIGIMPVKTAEFIILRFICTNQSANVEEVTSQNI